MERIQIEKEQPSITVMIDEPPKVDIAPSKKVFEDQKYRVTNAKEIDNYKLQFAPTVSIVTRAS